MDSSIIPFVSNSFSFTEVLRKSNICPNARNIKKLRSVLTTSNIDFSHFNSNGVTPAGTITKDCPVCNEPFIVSAIGRRSRQTTCSYGCANTHFATRRRKPKSYRAICFKHHGKKCLICDEKLIVEVHHYDGNRKNNTPENLMPLCSTHHQYWHSRYRYMIKEKIDKYREEFLKNLALF